MAAAALAYKCMEVAYMRAIYSSHAHAKRDRHELQMALQIIPPGESPSSSASDIDNLNHTTIADKVPLTKGTSSPQVTGSHIIAAQNRPNFVRLLRFAQDVNSAMEASRKSRVTFAAANVSLGEDRCGEAISSIKTALDFNFQDVEGLLRLVRLAIEAISRIGEAAVHLKSGSTFNRNFKGRDKEKDYRTIGNMQKELSSKRVPNVKWEDAGGLEDVKKSILDAVQLPLLHKEMFSSGLGKLSGLWCSSRWSSWNRKNSESPPSVDQADSVVVEYGI
ncbi:unnamed protein product [Dovyalis caffra]|uniref:CWZF3/5/7 THD domain-containing protein n=1 Tax=Dovyalis caffra TaxID=77055 RepID=A0AAV1SAA1_9ROSI|nr:unnamed protein product [Dovyalis caffra]